MAEPFIGEIKMFGGNFAPRGWAFCNGQLLAISSNTALFSILGTIYGGDGRTSFGLPDLRGRVAMHAGNGPGLTPRPLGQKSGQEQVTLNTLQIPSHNHQGMSNATISLANGVGNATAAVGSSLATASAGSDGSAATGPKIYSDAGVGANKMNVGSMGGTTGNAGGNQSHNNMQPYQTVNYIIALQGVYPSRS